MPLRQITAFLEDRRGALHELLELLAQAGINIRALSMGDSRDYGALRLIVSEHDRALEVLRTAHVPVREVQVLAAEVADRPGGLAAVVALLAEREIDIQYCYAFFTRQAADAWVIIRVPDPGFASAVLTRHGIRLLTEADVAGVAA